jgi:hypothetical protein
VRSVRLTILLLLVAMMLVPAAAQADDTSVYGAYVSRDAEFAQLGKEYRSREAAWQRSASARNARRLLSTVKKTRTLIAELSGAVKAQQSSSDNGKRAKAYALRSLGWFDSAEAAVASAVRAGRARRWHDERVWGRRSNARMDAAADNETLARRYFKRAGVQIKPA